MARRSSRRGGIALLVLVVLAIGQCGGTDEEPAATEKTPADTLGTTPGTTPEAAIEAATGDEPAATPRPRPTPRPARTFFVTSATDGDTLRLRNGRSVRLIGVDAPEMGVCGSQKATDNLVRLAEGRRVRLTGGTDDRDRYDRLLRYVDIDGMDAGLRLIKNGLAIARYDSRDGYGHHPREARYVAADRASRSYRCLALPAPVPVAGGSGAGACGGYSPCLPSYPPDLDCPDVNGPITVTGADPHGLDGDGDGVACE